jgi:hypothetical protein
MTFLSLRKLFSMLSFFCICALGASFVLAQEKEWRPISPAELASKTPVVEQDADAEAIFWEVRVDDSSADELALRHYVRVKIFTERGRDQFKSHDIVFTKGTKVKDVEARVTKPDGSMVFLKKEDVLEREIVKASGVKVKAKSFALPGLEIGSIVEYRYKEVYDNAEANMRLIFQREVPIQTISYFVKPFSGSRGMYYEPFNTGTTRFEKDKNGFHRATMTNVPAFREEPSMAAEDEVRSWIYIYYSATEPKKPLEYWRDIGKFAHELSKERMKVSDEVKRVTAEAINGAATDEDKLKRIYEYTKTQVRNLSYANKRTDEEWKNALKSKTPGDTLKLKYGTATDVDNLFGAMARAAGYDARQSLSGSRNELTFDRSVANAALMLNSSSVAVRVGDKWRFFSPGSYYAPFGMLSWAEEGQIALIADSKEPIWESMEFAPADRSRETRTGKFKLNSDGTLEGEGTIEYTGHWAAFIKAINRGDSDVEKENRLKNLLKSSILGTTEVESFSMENLDDPEKPVVYRFKIKVPGFAARTGKRLFFQPNVFERSSKPRFTTNTRKYDISFNYPYSEKDKITIELPDGFALENADAPYPISDKQGIGVHKVSIGVRDNKELIYSREFSFGNNGLVRFQSASYPALKGLFEAFNKADVHQLTLRESAAVSTTK